MCYLIELVSIAFSERWHLLFDYKHEYSLDRVEWLDQKPLWLPRIVGAHKGYLLFPRNLLYKARHIAVLAH